MLKRSSPLFIQKARLEFRPRTWSPHTLSVEQPLLEKPWVLQRTGREAVPDGSAPPPAIMLFNPQKQPIHTTFLSLIPRAQGLLPFGGLRAKVSGRE